MATNLQVQALYIAYFGRPADPAGLAYWADGTSSATGSLEVIADGFASTPEYKAETAGKTSAAIINNFYQNLFNRDADVDGLNFWVNQVAIGNANIQDVGLFIGAAALEAEVAEGDTNVDKDALTAKGTAAGLWTTEVDKTTQNILAYQGQEAIQAGRVFLQPVVSTATVPTEAAVAATLAALAATNSVSAANKLDLTIFQDVASSTADYMGVNNKSGDIAETSKFRFTSESQIINSTFGGVATFNALDSLVDASTTDNDIININGVGAIVAKADMATLTNIETLNFGLTNATGDLDLTKGSVTGVKNINVKGSVLGSAATAINFDFTGSGATSFDLSGLTGVATGAKISSASLTMGGNANNTIVNGDVAMSAGKGIDVGNGDDTITSGAGADKAEVGGGVNTINLGGGINTVTELGTGGKGDTIIQDVDGTTNGTVSGTGTVTLTNTAGKSTIDGSGGVNTIDAATSTKAVTLNGLAGDDTLTGGSGGDTIDGGANKDTIIGGDGADKITGGSEADTLTGGAGADVYTQGAGSTAVATAGAAASTVTDGNTITFANKIDIIKDFDIANDTFATGDAGNAVNLTAGAAIAAGKNNGLRGNYNATSGVFKINLAAGADTLVFSSEAADLKIAASIGTNAILLENVSGITLTDAMFA